MNVIIYHTNLTVLLFSNQQMYYQMFFFYFSVNLREQKQVKLAC